MNVCRASSKFSGATQPKRAEPQCQECSNQEYLTQCNQSSRQTMCLYIKTSAFYSNCSFILREELDS